MVDEGIELLFDELNLKYRCNDNYYIMTCPVHDGDNTTAVNFYLNNREPKIVWKCNTHQCEKRYGMDLPGFIMGIMEQQTGQKWTYIRALKWIADLYKIDLNKIKSLTPAEQEKKDFINNTLNTNVKEEPQRYTRDKIRQLLEIPAQYFIQRGFSAQILDKYDIGYYHKYERVTVPIYDQDYQYIVGFTMRSIYDECPKCGNFHAPSNTKCTMEHSPKWRNSRRFYTDNHLFNYWFAKPHIQRSKVAILVEGIGDCLRLVENGIQNVVSIFGSELKQGQKRLLLSTGIHSLIIMLDNDKAGQEGAAHIKESCRREFNMYFPKFSGKDVGELNADEITHEIKHFLNKIKI